MEPHSLCGLPRHVGGGGARRHLVMEPPAVPRQVEEGLRAAPQPVPPPPAGAEAGAPVMAGSLLASCRLVPGGEKAGSGWGGPCCAGDRGVPSPHHSLVRQVEVWPSPHRRQLLLKLHNAQTDVPRGQQQGHHPGGQASVRHGDGAGTAPQPGSCVLTPGMRWPGQCGCPRGSGGTPGCQCHTGEPACAGVQRGWGPGGVSRSPEVHERVLGTHSSR